MHLINCQINLDLNWSENCVIVATDVAAQAITISITDAKLYVVTLSTQDNAKLFEQSKSGFNRTINWHKYQAKASTERINQYLDFLIDLNRLFVLPFENEAQRISYKRYYQPIRNNLITYDNIRKFATGQGDDYTTGCLLNYNYKMIA